MKKALFFVILCCAGLLPAYGQTVFLADTAFVTDVGFDGAPASCVYEPDGVRFGLDNYYPLNYWIADFFTVPAGAEWAFDTVIVYGYQIGSALSSPFTAAYLSIYQDGPPGFGGSVVWGDGVTNLLVSTAFTGIYRVDTTASSGGLSGTQRPIMSMKLYLSPAPHLTAGTYWLSWSTNATGTQYTDCPPKVLPGRINPSGQNALFGQAGVWSTIIDGAEQTLGFNKIIIGSDSAVAGLAAPNTPANGSSAWAHCAPNPFNASTSISFYLPQAGYAKRSIYNTLGQLVSTLADGTMSAGKHQATFDAANWPASLYYYRLSDGASQITGQMVLAK